MGMGCQTPDRFVRAGSPRQRPVGRQRTRRRHRLCAQLSPAYARLFEHGSDGHLVPQIDDSDVLAMFAAERRELAAKRIAKATKSSSSELVYPKLVEESGVEPRIHDTPPTIFHPDEVRDPGYMNTCREVLAKYRETLADDRRALFDRFELMDIAVKVVGIGSVGTLCLVALFMSIAGRPFFLQIKEANASVLEALCGRQRLQPSRPAGGDGSTDDAAGVRPVPRLGDRAEGSAFLSAPTAGREDFGPG